MQEYWSGLPFPTPGDLPHPGIKPTSPASPAIAGGFFTTESPSFGGKPKRSYQHLEGMESGVDNLLRSYEMDLEVSTITSRGGCYRRSKEREWLKPQRPGET